MVCRDVSRSPSACRSSFYTYVLSGSLTPNKSKPTFFPGFPSTVPFAFLTAPLTLSVALGLRFCFVPAAAAGFFVTRPVVVAFARGLEVFALGFATPPEPEAGFFAVDLVLVLVLVVLVVVLVGGGAYALRGADMPVCVVGVSHSCFGRMWMGIAVGRHTEPRVVAIWVGARAVGLIKRSSVGFINC